MNGHDSKTQVLEMNSNLSDSDTDGDNTSDVVPKNNSASVKLNFESSDEECAPVSRVKKRLQRFTDSDSDVETDVQETNKVSGANEIKNKISTSEQSESNDSDSDSDNHQSNKNEEQQLRMKNKRNKLRQKFKSLVTSRSKETSKVLPDSEKEQNHSNSDESMDEETFLNNEQETNNSMPFKSSICDPDTSDEENINDKKQKHVSKLHQRKSTKPVSPKPLRMSAKQAMENMQKIRSESNRLLREREISLPYHRPKAFSLKDIMSRRKPAISADGKALPIKMNTEQLKEYAQILEQRQKEIMDLCKSESDEEQDNCDTAFNQKESLETTNDQCTENNKDNSTNVQAADLTLAKDIPLQKETELTNIDGVCDKNMKQDNSSNIMEVDTQCSSEDNLLAINNNLNKENEEPNIHKIAKNDTLVENVTQNLDVTDKSVNEEIAKIPTEPESQIINLHYDSENTLNDKLVIDGSNSEILKKDEFELRDNDSSDDIDMDYIDQLIENADNTKDKTYENTAKSSTLSTTAVPLDIKPKLTGAPGMVIDLDGNESITCKKMSGVELLKERFTFFAKLKTPEELERENEKKLKPGVQHLKLKQELENIIAEQRSLEWAKRLNEEKQKQMELKELRGEESDAEEDIEKIEALIDEKDVAQGETSEEGESEPEEDDLGEIKEKPRKKHSMIDDEADESDCNEDIEEKQTDINEDENKANDIVNEENDSSDEETSSDEASDDESEDEEEVPKVKKGRILKAFVDSDDETANEREKTTDNIKVNDVKPIFVKDKIITENNKEKEITNKDMGPECEVGSQMHKQSQDDEIQLAQRMESASDDMFGSQESASLIPRTYSQGDDDENALGTQTFSILKSTNTNDVLCNLENSQKLSFTQTLDSNLDAAAAHCPGEFIENLIPSSLTSSQPAIEQSLPIGEDVLALCTGNFYDNQFISQSGENKESEIQEAVNDTFDDSWSKVDSQEKETDTSVASCNTLKDNEAQHNANIIDNVEMNNKDQPQVKSQQKAEDRNLLQSIIDELNDDKIDTSKLNKYFPSKDTHNDENDKFKKKFVIESDDEMNVDVTEKKKKKKVKKKKPEQRALQISDDEEEDSYEEEDLVQENEAERIVEYDSEENEIEVIQQNPKKKRKAIDFFENEAELTSEDEWVGSGDEDEAGLDRMEREEGDDETFHQGKLQRELGQIHMRDVLDQDKREVRLIQELLFEDGDLGGGSRQRKFRWRNADGEEGPDAIVNDFADTQEEEFESEEQWRKQRHERETFLRQMEEQEKNEDSPNVTISRTSIIKANLTSKSMSSLLLEVNDTTIKKTDIIENSMTKEKPFKDIPNPINGFTILQQNYHSSLLTRGRGALARLAALATPLAVDEDSTKVATVAQKNQRNFVFAAITKEDNGPKVTKRKADSKMDTPRLVKKLKTKEKQTLTRNSLLDHLKI
ncbi:hypothetical protein O3G_MSEX006354 [Manduca sexta]|uniref:Claspin n=1 Tax=Manduca sexta TaxID=7130 RepID=A0A921Z429_MANSE|nr:hypothetical protein O3G_MSEX006354 [Manduca sexta]